MDEQNDYTGVHKRLNTSHVNTRAESQGLRLNSDLAETQLVGQPATVRANVTPKKKQRGEATACTSQKSKKYQKVVQQRLKHFQEPINQKGKFRFASNDSADSNHSNQITHQNIINANNVIINYNKEEHTMAPSQMYSMGAETDGQDIFSNRASQ